MGFEHHHESTSEHEAPRLHAEDLPRASGQRLKTMRLRIARKDLPRLREALRRLYASDAGERLPRERRDLARRDMALADRMDMERGRMRRYEGSARSPVARPEDVETYLRAVENLRSLEAYRDRLQQQLESHIYPMPGGGPRFAPGTYPHGGGGPGLNFGPRGYPGNLLGGRSGWYHGGGFPRGGFQGFRGNFGLQQPFGNFGRQQYNWYSGFPAYEGGGGEGGGGGPWLGNLGGGIKHTMGGQVFG